ncbi:uncharacterized protein LOC143071653 isoform X2 [Mytilus galloprovincialis]|uniref:uncharacterized protein LOC143071653 isoform X2 n=1 Tax=Mytilus galloprovincialis TaxID=29158 RepID=UPI003F7B6B44
MMKLLLKTIIAAETKPPSPPPEEPSPSLVSISKSDVIKHQLNRTPMGEYIVNPGEKPLTSLGNPGPGPANYNPCPNLTKEAAPQYSIVGKPKKKEHGRGLPGPADYGTSGDLIWKKKYAIKGRATCYFDEEASKYCTVIGPAKYNVRNKQFGMEGLKYSMAHKQPGDIITGPPNNIVQPSDTHGYATPGPNYRPNSRYWTRGQKKSMGAAQKKNIRDGPGPADYSVSATYSGPSYSFGVKLPPAPNIQRIRKLSIASEPLPGKYFMNSVMDFRTTTSRSGSVLDRYTSYSSMQPNHELLSPRFFAGTPAPNQYNLKSSIGLQPGTSMKGNRRRNFDRAKADCSFLLPELIDGFPSPNSYNTNKSTIGLGPGVSFKGKRGGPFQTNKGQMYIPAQYNERDKMSESYDTTSYTGKSSGVSFKGNRRRRIVMEAKNANAGFLLPNLIEASPGPGSYNIKSTIGRSNGVSFKGRKTGPFQSNKGATYINPEVNEKEMRPGHYTLASSIGNSPGVSFKGNRQRTFESAKASNALFLLPNSVNDTPAPGFYSMKSSIGSEHSVSMKEPVRPGPGDYTLTTANMKKDPAYSVRQQTHPSYPESLNYVPKSQSDVPGPGNYHISRDVMENESPAYSMRQQLKAVENDVPAPNKYEYEKKRIERGSKFSMGKRFTLPNSMKDSPGPGTYSPKQLKCSPKYSMKGRTPIISKSGNTPSPNSYSIPPEIKVDDKKAGVTIKSRASPYVYSGFRSTKLADGFNIAVPLKA